MYYRDIEGKQSKKIKKSIADISYSLCVITKSLVISLSKKKTELNFTTSELHMDDCLQMYQQLFGEDSEEFMNVRDQLCEGPEGEQYV